jgi:phosphoribosylaminoimidazolecarboxamide formyltransferase/IMP cyclohydrolase
MVRAAAKNHPSVSPSSTSPASYDNVLGRLSPPAGSPLEQRQRPGREAFAHTAAYDVAVAAGWARCWLRREGESCFPKFGRATFTKGRRPEVRREPPQKPRCTPTAPADWPRPSRCSGKEMSLQQLRRHRRLPRRARGTSTSRLVAIIKHANPCGLAVGADVAEAPPRRPTSATSSLGLRWRDRGQPARSPWSWPSRSPRSSPR